MYNLNLTNNFFSVYRISELADGFTKYTTTTKIVSQGKDIGNLPPLVANNNKNNKDHNTNNKSNNRPSTEATITLVKDSADILLAPNGNLVQNLLVEESATALNAQMKDVLREVLVSNPERIRNSIPLGLGRFLPTGPVDQIEPFLMKSDKEKKVQALAQKLSSLLSLPNPPSVSQVRDFLQSYNRVNNDGNMNNMNGNAVDSMSPEEIALLWKSLRENVPIYAPQVATLGGKFATSFLEKVSDNIDSVIEESNRKKNTIRSSSVGGNNGGGSNNENNDLADQLVTNSARSISAAAKESANVLKPLIANNNGGRNN